MQKLITYPAGYPLFELKQPDGTTQAMKGIPWPISVYHDPTYAPLSVKAAQTEGTITMQFSCTLNGAAAVATADSGA